MGLHDERCGGGIRDGAGGTGKGDNVGAGRGTLREKDAGDGQRLAVLEGHGHRKAHAGRSGWPSRAAQRDVAREAAGRLELKHECCNVTPVDGFTGGGRCDGEGCHDGQTLGDGWSRCIDRIAGLRSLDRAGSRMRKSRGIAQYGADGWGERRELAVAERVSKVPWSWLAGNRVKVMVCGAGVTVVDCVTGGAV